MHLFWSQASGPNVCACVWYFDISVKFLESAGQFIVCERIYWINSLYCGFSTITVWKLTISYCFSSILEMVPCNICNKRLRKDNLKRHVDAVHNKAKVYCPNCNTAFSTKGAMTRHLQNTCAFVNGNSIDQNTILIDANAQNQGIYIQWSFFLFNWKPMWAQFKNVYCHFGSWIFF